MPRPLRSALLLIGLLAGCAARATAARPAPRDQGLPLPRPAALAPSSPPAAGLSWLRDVPNGCALGDSGPMLNPASALGEARRRARARLLAALAPVRVRASAQISSSRADPSGSHREVILEEVEGMVQRSTVVALWYDSDGLGPTAVRGCAYAVACNAGSGDSTRSWIRQMEADRRAPGWVYGLEAGSSKLCAVGLSGPTLNKQDAVGAAEVSARQQLAEAIAVRIKAATAIFDSDEVLYGAVTEVCDSCLETAQQGKIVASWMDEHGEGPLPFPGTAYALVCTGP